jgi:hypothetical protein
MDGVKLNQEVMVLGWVVGSLWSEAGMKSRNWPAIECYILDSDVSLWIGIGNGAG